MTPPKPGGNPRSHKVVLVADEAGCGGSSPGPEEVSNG